MTIASTELYDLLGVQPKCAQSTIKTAFRKLAKQHHPDVGGDADAFMRVEVAYRVLSDPEKRATYNETGQVDLATIVDEREETLKVLVGVFEGHLSAGFIRAKERSVIPEMRKMINAQCDQMRQAMIVASEEIVELTDFRKSITTKTKDHINVFANVITARIEAQEKEKKTIGDALKYGELALKELENYVSFARMTTQLITPMAFGDTAFGNRSSNVRSQVFQLDDPT
jgi:curved DNA-binding protein CbpA